MLIKTYLEPTLLIQSLFRLKLLDQWLGFLLQKDYKQKSECLNKKTVHHLRYFQRC